MSLLFLPGGGVYQTEREEEHVPMDYLRMLMVLADTGAQMGLGLHCANCKQDLVGDNDILSPTFRMECACRTFVGKNPTRAA